MKNNKIKDFGKRVSLKGKLISILAFLMILVLIGCDQNRQEAERLQVENEELKKQIESNQENVESYFSALNEIEENLLQIKQKEDLIAGETARDLELGRNQQERINEHIMQIGELMEKNRALIASLNRRIRNSDVRIAEFEKTVARLNQTIEEKEIEIQVLRDQLGQMNLRVDFLSARVDTLEREGQRKAQLLQQQTQEMNRAYFAIGSRKELVDNNIITREGGFLGIGRSNKVRADLNHDFFTRLDMTNDFEITIAGSNPQLITSHPSDSYEIGLDDDVNVLYIKNADRFWGTSKYLVIQVR
jgi:uncharacterized coiled-coil protein SlyX